MPPGGDQYPPPVGLSRRALLIGSTVLGAAAGAGGWALLADARLVPGRSALDEVLGRCDIVGEPAEAEPGIMVRSSFFSSHRRRSVGYALAYPPNAKAGASLPVCLVLHGSGDDHRRPFDGLRYHRLLAAAVAAGVPPFVLASIDGGEAWWHPRASGDDPLGMLLEDFPVVLGQHGLPGQTFAVFGYSMGGYGALLAAAEAPKRFLAVVASAPAVWLSYDDARGANAAAFDSAADWQKWGDLRTRTTNLAGLPVRIDCGESDSFAPALKMLRQQLPDPSMVHLAKGCHDDAFWRSVAPEQLRLIGQALTPPKRA
jgi:pimeloyl-ACP methyl ester carboxylesterase